MRSILGVQSAEFLVFLRMSTSPQFHYDRWTAPNFVFDSFSTIATLLLAKNLAADSFECTRRHNKHKSSPWFTPASSLLYPASSDLISPYSSLSSISLSWRAKLCNISLSSTWSIESISHFYKRARFLSPSPLLLPRVFWRPLTTNPLVRVL